MKNLDNNTLEEMQELLSLLQTLITTQFKHVDINPEIIELINKEMDLVDAEYECEERDN
jgi:hypothetical protein